MIKICFPFGKYTTFVWGITTSSWAPGVPKVAMLTLYVSDNILPCRRNIEITTYRRLPSPTGKCAINQCHSCRVNFYSQYDFTDFISFNYGYLIPQ